MGSGHRVTALYELELKAGAGNGLATVRLRAKAPRGWLADEKAFVFSKAHLAARFDDATSDFRFATSVMGAAEIFRRSPEATRPGDAERTEFLSLLEQAKALGSRVAAR